MFSKEIGIDLGTANILIYIKGEGIVLNEPTVVAIDADTKQVLATGSKANEMLGRTPGKVKAIKPLKDGVIADFESTRALMQNLISRVVQKSLFYRPRIVVSIPSGITDVEERAVEGVVYKSGAKEVYLMEEVMAAAIGSGLEVEKPEGAMIVDLGGGTSEMAVLSLGGIVVSNSVKIAGEKLDKDIVEYIKQKFNVIIGDGEAEEVKKQIGAATAAMTEDRMEVKGRNLLTGLPETITVTTEDINEAMKDSLNEILRIIKLTLEQTPPELASDIMERGITLSGGLSLLRNIDRLISDETGMPVFIADEPEKCVVKGVGMALDNIEVLKKATKTRK